jgi:hypothetical protein
LFLQIAFKNKTTPYLKNLQIHEITPVKFGGSPTDPANKLFLPPELHAEYTNFWNALLHNMKQ